MRKSVIGITIFLILLTGATAIEHEKYIEPRINESLMLYGQADITVEVYNEKANEVIASVFPSDIRITMLKSDLFTAVINQTAFEKIQSHPEVLAIADNRIRWNYVPPVELLIITNLNEESQAGVRVEIIDTSGLPDGKQRREWYENLSMEIINTIPKSDYLYLLPSSQGFYGIINRSALEIIIQDKRISKVLDNTPQVVAGFPEQVAEEENQWYKNLNGTLVANEVLRQLLVGTADVFVQLKSEETPDKIIEILGDEFVLDEAINGYFSGTITANGLIKLVETTRVLSIDPDTTSTIAEKESVLEENVAIANESSENITESSGKKIEDDVESMQYGWIVIIGSIAIFFGILYILSKKKTV